MAQFLPKGGLHFLMGVDGRLNRGAKSSSLIEFLVALAGTRIYSAQRNACVFTNV